MSLDSVAQKHQRKIARQTLKMTEAMARVMGGMTHDEAREVLGIEASNQYDQCEALMIQGVYCHETGCPNMPR